MVMDSLPLAGDNDGTLPLEPENWLESASMQQLLDREASLASQPSLPDPAPSKAGWVV